MDIRVLLLEPCHAEYHIVVLNNCNNKVDLVAPLCYGTLPHAYYLAYNSNSAQRLAIDSGDRQGWLPFPRRLQT